MTAAWAFEPGSTGATPQRVDDALDRMAQGSGPTVWVDLDPPTDECLSALDAVVGLGEFLLEDLREGRTDAGQRTKLEQHGSVFHVAVHDCEVVGRHLVEREIDLVFGPGWLCSIRHPGDAPEPGGHEPFPVADVLRRLEAHAAHETTFDEGFVVWAFLDLVTDRYLAITDAIDERLDAAEATLLDHESDGDGRPHGSPRELFDIGRLLTRLRHHVVPLREVVGALLRREYATISGPALLHLRDVYDHLLGITELVESQRDVLAGLRDVHLTVVSNQMNRSMQQLAAWGAILIVATLVTGVLGMNFRDAPNVSWRTGFAVVVAVIGVITVPMWLVFRRKRWL